MKMTEEVTNNRNNLIYAIALVEDITRTNNGIYESLKGLTSNPQGLINIKKSIDNLYEKVTNLKNSDIGTPLFIKEKVIVPGPEDISPDVDPDYKEPIETPSKPEPVVEAEAGELVVEKPPRKPRKNPRKNVNRGRRPMKPLKNKKKLPSPDIDSI